MKLSDGRTLEKVASKENLPITVVISNSSSFRLKIFFFETTSGITLTLYFETKETIEKLLRAFFNEVKKPILFEKMTK